MQTTFQKDWIKEQDETTACGYAKATMLRDKYDMMNTETLWLDDYDEEMIVFVGNSYNYDIVEKNQVGLKKVADKIHNKFPNIQDIYFGHLIFTYN